MKSKLAEAIPSNLWTPNAAHGSDEARSRCLDALARHYNLPVPFERNDLPPTKMAKRWELLAMSMAVEKFPAFNSHGDTGRPPRKRSGVYPWAHEARLVQLVTAIRIDLTQKGDPKTLLDVFKKLVDLLAKKPAPAWAFGSLKASSLSQEWKQVPSDVKDAPGAFLPPVTKNTEEDDPLSREARRIWQELPPVPRHLVKVLRQTAIAREKSERELLRAKIKPRPV